MSEYNVMALKHWSGEVSEYHVTNEPKDWRKDAGWPCVAVFPVKVGYSNEEQRRRAIEYCDYMNKTTPQQPPIGST